MCYDTYLFIGIQQAFLSITIPEFQVSSTKQCVTVTILKILKKPVGSCMLHHWGVGGWVGGGGCLVLNVTVCISLQTTKKGVVQFNVSPVGTYHSFVDDIVSFL